jgi:BASS family bile acid:Na+ symporter
VAAFLTASSHLFSLLFVVTSMLSMGLALTMPQIVAPLHNTRLVAQALLANFIVVPFVALLLSRLLLLDADLQIGLLLLGTAAGAPFLPKLSQIAKADITFALGLMTLLVVMTVVYMPLVLPLLLPGVKVDVGQITLSLFLEVLVPLGIGLVIKARYEDVAAPLLHPISQISYTSLALLLVLVLGLNFGNVLNLLGSGALIASVLLVGVAVMSGYSLGGPYEATRRVLALGTGQRNLAAASVIATTNFSGRTNVMVLVAAAGLIAMIIVMPLAAELGKRAPAPDSAPTQQTPRRMPAGTT